MKTSLQLPLIAITSAFALGSLVSCEKKSTGSEIKENVDDALDRRPNEEIKDAAEDVGDAAEDAAEDVKDSINDATE